MLPPKLWYSLRLGFCNGEVVECIGEGSMKKTKTEKIIGSYYDDSARLYGVIELSSPRSKAETARPLRVVKLFVSWAAPDEGWTIQRGPRSV